MGVMSWLFGGGVKQVSTAVAQLSGVVRPHGEASAARDHDYSTQALGQYAAEYQDRRNRTGFDSLVDGINRLVRPIITLSVLGIIPAVMIWPEELAMAFSALALLPTGYWALLSIIVGFYFGGRMQLKSQDFARSVKDAVARAPQVIETMDRLRDHLTPGEAADESGDEAQETSADLSTSENAAVAAWRKASG